MIEYEVLTPFRNIGVNEYNLIVCFFQDHLGNWADKVGQAIDHSVGGLVNNGGFLVIAKQGDRLVGGCIICRTGMTGFMPENVLTHLAVHQDFQGQRIGSTLMTKTITLAQGQIALNLPLGEDKVFSFFEKFGFKGSGIQYLKSM